MKRTEPTSTYCLYCYAPLGPERGATQHCRSCGQLNVRADHSIFWTREPSLEKLEHALKLVIIGALVIGSLIAIPEFIEMKAVGPGAGWVIVVPMVAMTMLLWQTASLLTRRPRYVRIRLTWTLLFLLVPIAPLLYGSAIALSVDARSLGWIGLAGGYGGLVLLPSLALAGLVWRSGTWLERWKCRRIARGGAID
jgi:hypothetical protein